LNEKLKKKLERIGDIYGNILESIHEEKALGNQEKQRTTSYGGPMKLTNS
jgi:hypothetical protein